jgi:hypothetical protein
MVLIFFGQILRGLVSCKWYNLQIEGKRITNQQHYEGKNPQIYFYKNKNCVTLEFLKTDFFGFLPSQSC